MQQGKPFETDNKTENQITQRDAIINFLTNQLLQRQSHKSHINQKSMTYNNKH